MSCKYLEQRILRLAASLADGIPSVLGTPLSASPSTTPNISSPLSAMPPAMPRDRKLRAAFSMGEAVGEAYALGKDEQVYVYSADDSKLYRDVSHEDLRDRLVDDGIYAEAMRAGATEL